MNDRVKEWILVVAIGTAITPCVSWTLWNAFMPRPRTDQWLLVTPGMTKDEVETLLGPPHYVEDDGTTWAYFAEGCIWPLFPMYVSFDEQDKVIARGS